MNPSPTLTIPTPRNSHLRSMDTSLRERGSAVQRSWPFRRTTVVREGENFKRKMPRHAEGIPTRDPRRTRPEPTDPQILLTAPRSPNGGTGSRRHPKSFSRESFLLGGRLMRGRPHPTNFRSPRITPPRPPIGQEARGVPTGHLIKGANFRSSPGLPLDQRDVGEPPLTASESLATRVAGPR